MRQLLVHSPWCREGRAQLGLVVLCSLPTPAPPSPLQELIPNSRPYPTVCLSTRSAEPSLRG